MFDLFRSRDKIVRIFLGAILVLVSLSMLTYLVPSYDMGASSSDMVVAQIGKETITVPEVQRVIQNAVRSRQMPPNVVANVLPQMIQQMIAQRAVAYEAKRLGYRVSDQDIATAIRQLIPSLFPDGKFAGKQAYEMMLEQQNTSIPEFETTLARQLLATRLRDVVLEGTVVSDKEIEQAYKRQNEKIKVEYVKISPDKLRSEVKVTPEEMKTYYDAHRADFRIPEQRNLGILIIDQAKVEQTITPTDAELQRMYDQNKDSFRTPERVKVRHILLTTTGKSPKEVDAIKAKAEDILKQVKASKGADFAKLAKKYSEDPGSAANGGELPNWVVRGQTVPAFEKVAFSLKPGQISDLVKTQYGFHIIQVLAKQEAHLKTLDEAKPQLITEYKNQRANQLVQKLSDEAEAALKKDPLHPEKVAKDLNIDFVAAQKIEAGAPVPGIGVNPDFQDALNGLKKGDVSDPVVLPGNKMALAVVTDVFPSHPASFEEAQDQIRQNLFNQKLNALVEQKANELVAKSKSMNGDLKKAAQSMGFEVKNSDPVTRKGAVEGLGSASYIADAFNQPVGSVLGPISIPGAKAVVKVVGHIQADMAGLAAQRDTVRDELKSQMAQERNALFEAGLVDRLSREGKIKIHQDVIKRLISNYNG